MFVNTFTANEKYSPLNGDNFTQPIEIRLSQIKNFFSEFFCAVSKSRLNFERFQKKADPPS